MHVIIRCVNHSYTFYGLNFYWGLRIRVGLLTVSGIRYLWTKSNRFRHLVGYVRMRKAESTVCPNAVVIFLISTKRWNDNKKPSSKSVVIDVFVLQLLA